ncbi:hypothetical protein GCM10010912_67880 [Paenibacillus albidus]|uniref:Uncharacterized protein n=1 Tax=Paenibacillus albidus TaxID=2041023 RepID=A0A917FY76_9BACL|nr:hypothetical protein [Paenibacillus albidus]GGG13892.1 hypothetical protein GCM10010912_67880 [Paenibacillus albidus]
MLTLVVGMVIRTRSKEPEWLNGEGDGGEDGQPLMRVPVIRVRVRNKTPEVPLQKDPVFNRVYTFIFI